MIPARQSTNVPQPCNTAPIITLRRIHSPHVLKQIRAGHIAALEYQSGTFRVRPISARIVLERNPTPSRSVQLGCRRVGDVRSCIDWHVGIRGDICDWQRGDDLVDGGFDCRDFGSVLEARGVGGTPEPWRHDGCV